MNDQADFYFQSYEEWRQTITGRCNIDLTPEYARKRIAALRNPSDRSTREFTTKYGKAYLNQVIKWFEQAEQG